MAATGDLTPESAILGRELTSRQLLIWTEQQLAPDVPSNNMLMCFTIDGEVEPEKFERAFRTVVNDFDALRTVVREANGSPLQFVQPEAPRPVEFVDLSEEADPEEAFRAWRDLRCVRRFELDEQLFDCVLVRLGDRRSIWFLCQHHIICDAWSFSLIFRRTAELYEAPEATPAGGRIRSFAQYLDYELEYRASEAHAAHAAFWKERFASPIEPLHLYGVDPHGKRPAVRRLSIDLGDARSRKIRELAQREEMRAATETLSLSLIFTTALYAYLHRASGNETIGIGCPVQNRPSRWSKHTVGLFMEVCPFHVEISEDDSFVSLHEKVVRENFKVLPHSRFSVSNPIRNKRYDAMLNFHNATISDFAGRPARADLRTGLVAMASPAAAEGVDASASFDAGDCLTLQVLDFSDTGRFQLHFEFNVDVFDDAASQRGVEHFANLLDAMLSDPTCRVNAAPMLTAEERESILSELEETTSEPLDDRPVLERFREWVSRDPERTAVIPSSSTEPQTGLSYRELDERIRILGSAIRGAGVGYEDRVAVCLTRSPDLLVALLATHDASAAYVPIDPEQPAERIELILEDAKPALIITEASLAERVAHSDAPKLLLEPSAWTVEAPAPERAPAVRNGGQLAYVIFTSGSTGRPKGVEIEHRSLSNFMTSMARTPGLSETDRLLAITTASFDISALELFLPLTVGASLEIADEETCRDPGRLSGRIAASAITVMQATPATWQMLVDSGWSGRPTLRALCGGDALSRELADALLERAAEVWNLYGPTETTIWSTVERVMPGPEPISIGRPIDRTALRVLTPGHELVPRGVPGELFIGGDGLARGYCGRPDLTGERFVVTQVRTERLLYQTGDRVRQLPDGRVECLGRVDFQVKIRGFRIELGEIETALRLSDDVAEAVVVAQGAGAERHLVAYLVPRKEVEVDLEAIATALRGSLPAYMIPSRWMLLDRLPLTPNGKIDRRALLDEPGREARIAREWEPPRDDVEVQIAAIWRDLLGVSEIGRNDDFFDLGGNSLLAVEGLRRLDGELNEHLPLGTFFEQPTLAGVRAALQNDSTHSPPATIVELRPGTGPTPLFCVGGIHLYQALANALEPTHPVFGVFLHKDGERIAALRRGERPELPSTESMAREYIEIIRGVQPHGPYRLAGLSYGGILAYEIAQQLTSAGESVEGLILLDVRLQTALARAAGLRRYLSHRARALSAFLSRVGALRDPSRDPAEMHDMMFVEALVRYERRIQPYTGGALLCRALDQAPEAFEWDPSLGWGALIQGGLALADCPGDHLGLIDRENAEVAAGAIETYLSSGQV